MAQANNPPNPVDLAATVDLASLVHQITAACFGDLQRALHARPQPPKKPEELQAAWETLLGSAKARLLRLSLILEGSRVGGPLERGLALAQRCRALERQAYQLRQFSERVARLHRDLHLGLATRQVDVDTAAALVRGGDLSRVGLPAMAEDLIESLRRPYTVWRLPPDRAAAAADRLVAGTLHCLAQSNIPRDSSRLRVEVREDGVHMAAPGAFEVDAVYDLRRWVVLAAEPLAGRGHGVSAGKEGEEALRRHLQTVVDEEHQAEQSDVPAALCAAAHAFCSHVWLRVLHGEALQLARERQWELGSAWWDRRGFLLLRVCPDWDPSCGGLDPTQSKQGEDDARAVQQEGEDRRGCTIELHADPGGGVCLKSCPDLELEPLGPMALESGGVTLLERLIAKARSVLAERQLRRVQEALTGAGVVPEEAVEFMPGGPALRVTLRRCPLHILMDAAGRLTVCADGWSEVRGGLRSAASLAPGMEGLAARLEDARWEALCSAVSREAAAGGWSLWNDSTQPQDTVESSSRARKYQYRLGQSPLALRFELLESEVVAPVLTLAEWPGIELEAMLSHPRISVRELAPFEFGESTSGSCVSALQKGVRDLFATAKSTVEALPFSSSVFASLVQQTPVALAFGATAGAAPVLGQGEAGTCKLDAGYGAGRFECVLDWPSEGSAPKKQRRAMPFAPPIRVIVDEAAQHWALLGSLRSDFPLVPPEQATDTGGRVHEPEPLASGGSVHARRAKHRRRPQTMCRDLVLDFRHCHDWLQWPRDLRTLALLADLAAQAVEGEALSLPARLELCCPGRLRWRLPGLQGVGGDEVFELRAAHAASDQEREAMLCRFHWLAPRPRFLLAPQLSRQVCRTRDLAAALRTLAATVELVRMAEGVTEDDKDWSASGLSADGLSLEYRAMLGAALHVVAPGRLVCQCLSRRKRRQDGPHQLSVVPHFDAFMQLLVDSTGIEDGPDWSPAEPASGRISGCSVPYVAGRLAVQLAPLWEYLHRYCVLLQIYMLMKTEHASLLADSSFTMRVGDANDRRDPNFAWVTLKWARQALSLVFNVELFTRLRASAEEPAAKRARHDLSSPEKSPSTSRSGPAAGSLEVLLRFRWGLSGESEPPSGYQQRAQRVLGRFAAHFSELCRVPRVMRLLTPLALLGVPQLWMLEEASLLLSKDLRQATSAWVPLAERISLIPPATGEGTRAAWRLRFEVAPPSGSTEAPCCVMCHCREGEELQREGWDEVLIDGTPSDVWARWGGALEAIALRKAPYLLADLLGPLLEYFGGRKRQRGAAPARW